MRILVLGAGGMLGHRLWCNMSHGHDVVGTCRNPIPWLEKRANNTRKLISGVTTDDLFGLQRVLDSVDADIVVNCIGVIKQLPAGQDPVTTIATNSLFPHQLAVMCAERKLRLLHISTDCVFSGARGAYLETDLPDATDLYGRSKALGELDVKGALTLRTSIIGHELKNRLSLLEWFLSQKGTVTGYSAVLYNGLTTTELCRVIEKYVLGNPQLEGLYQVSSAAISKLDLLRIIREVYNTDVDITAVDQPVNDKTLVAGRFSTATGYLAPEWQQMIVEMRKDYLRSDQNG
jgi:dTDP-4-dehydrorhamnose reductase